MGAVPGFLHVFSVYPNFRDRNTALIVLDRSSQGVNRRSPHGISRSSGRGLQATGAAVGTGVGIGIDRLVMLFIDTRWIRDAIIFPTLKSLK